MLIRSGIPTRISRIAALLILTVGGAPLRAEPAEYVPSAANLEAREWFRDARFGLFVQSSSSWAFMVST
jgi:hypothetical protein